MIRRAAALAAATLAIVAAVEITSLLLAGTDALPARFAAQDCRRIALADSLTGRPISGAEDLALTPDGATLIVSAHDRRDRARPDGGLYAVPVRDLAAAGGAEPVPARPLVDAAARRTPFRPHGIALSPDGRRLAVVNRVAPREAVVEIGTFDGESWRAEAVVRDPALCRANDLAFEDAEEGRRAGAAEDAGTGGAGARADAGADVPNETRLDAWTAAGSTTGAADAAARSLGAAAVLVTIDRADCGHSLRDLAPWARTGSVLRIDGRAVATVRTGLAFPNGIALGPGSGPDHIAVAETRAGRLLRAQGREVPLSGAPDNLTVDGDALVVAVHTGLLRLWLHTGGVLGRAASRILRVAADTTVETLFDDPAGALLSGATVGLVAGGGLVAGAARDAGLLVCGDPA